MSTNNAVYDKLAEKYRLTGDAHFMELLTMLLTPEEGKYLLALDKPKTPSETAQILGLKEETAAAKMDNLARRGLLFRGKTQYLAWMDAHQLKARVMFSGEEYTHPGMIEHRRRDERYLSSPFAEIHGWLKLYEMTGRPLLRVIPARKAIAANPEIKPEQVLWYENIAEMLARAGKIGVVPCDCRRIYERCGKPLVNCLHFGSMVDYETGRGGRMKAIGVEEAIAICDEAEEAGLVHNQPGNNASLSGVICNCCPDCCSTFEPALESGHVNEVSAPSRFRPSVNLELCKGCRTCLKRCPFGAIEMKSAPGSKKPKASINAEKCLGCGVCVIGCKHKALTFEIVRPPEFIPPAPDLKQPLMFTVY
ncbi:MAG: 4Fe-4S binding protein [Dehalococcoidales bacterium]|jgi:ferredoxin